MSSQLAVLKPEQKLLIEWRQAVDLDIQAGDISQATGATYQRGMDKFMSWLSAREVDQVTPQVIQTWKAEQLARHKPSSVNTWYAGVKRFFEWANDAGLLAVNPTASVKNVKRKGTNKKHLRDMLTDREVLRVLSQPDRSTEQGRRDYAILCLMAFCALRTVEVHRADLADVSTVDGMPVLRVQGKGSTEKDETAVIYHPTAQEGLYDWLGDRGGLPGPLFISLSNRSHGERLTSSAIRHMVIAYFRKAGIVDPRKTTHSLRHSAISKVASQNIVKAKQVARHVNINTTMIYVHENDRLDNPGEQFIDYSNGS